MSKQLDEAFPSNFFFCLHRPPPPMGLNTNMKIKVFWQCHGFYEEKSLAEKDKLFFLLINISILGKNVAVTKHRLGDEGKYLTLCYLLTRHPQRNENNLTSLSEMMCENYLINCLKLSLHLH